MEIEFHQSKIKKNIEQISVEKLLKELGINSEEVVVTQNDQIVLESSILNKGDHVKIIQVIHGG
ncbi:MoaD/ThiS family protein [Methanobacterium alcaliphilum]|uniref:MoaD/ThiS family protein n=1 Tax=Methanobacterium alcaliphilum TaxID=392018 RepID=UPI00200B34C9|nr:MoaD/ThiS family protein [Methanobacterium alcaliphilum]MCK9150721.1 MoaD/ThiS family protein [Methanobacterium alcaliphilum]